MQHEDFTIKSNHDNLDLGVSLRIPERPIGIIQLVHGMAEHRERYHAFMEYCANQGLVAIIHDHRGHGASVKGEEDFGYFYTNGVEGIIQDVHQITKYVRSRFPELPLTLFGHSMGSLVVRCYMQEHDQDINGLIVCGSPSKRFGAKLAEIFASTLKIFKGERHRSPLINKLAFGGYNKRFTDVTSDNSWIVSDPSVVAAYDADPRDGFIFTLNGFEVLFKLINRAYSKKGWTTQNPTLPILFIAGADDPCIISQKDFYKSVQFLRDRGYANVNSQLYPHMRHEILNEIGKEQVWRDIIAQTKLTQKQSASA